MSKDYMILVYRLHSYIRYLYEQKFTKEEFGEAIFKILKLHDYNYSQIQIILSMLLFHLQQIKFSEKEDYRENCLNPLIAELTEIVTRIV